jgi:hypothetical protein
MTQFSAPTGSARDPRPLGFRRARGLGRPFVTSDGLVGGVVFAGDPAGGTGYALTAGKARLVVEAAIARNQVVRVGACRF